jgi:glucose/arabinose dehydrogenase
VRAKTRVWSVIPVVVGLVVTVGSLRGDGQQTVPFQGGVPVAPLGLSGRPLPTLPVVIDTAEGMKVRVSAVARGLENPWSIAFLPDGSMLVTERAGRLRIIRNGALDAQPVAGGPMAYGAGVSGLPGAVHGYMDVVLHPKFAQNRLIYLSYTKSRGVKQPIGAVARGRWDGKALVDMKDIFVTGEGEASAMRLAFGRDDTLYVTTTGATPQDPNTLAGKVLRLADDGSIPKDNPFVGKAGHRGEVFTSGHRSSLGLAMHPGTGQIWQNENGPNGGDEINILKPGGNYGWPVVSYGRTYPGPWQAERFWKEGFEYPIVYWTPSIAVSGMTFYTGSKLAKWKGDVFVGALRTGEVPGTGHLERILLNDKMEELRRESLLTDFRQRVRDVRMGPDELLYVLTDEKDGAVLRIEPAS